MSRVLVVGGTRGLGASLVKLCASDTANTVYGTGRSSETPSGFPDKVQWLHGIDLMQDSVGDDIVSRLPTKEPLSTVVSGI